MPIYEYLHIIYAFVTYLFLIFFNISRLYLEKAMATHSSTLAWKIMGGEPGRQQSMGSLRAGRD